MRYWKKNQKKGKWQALCNMSRFESVPTNVAKWKEKKKQKIPLSHEPERKQMESADAPDISFTPR